MSKTTDRFLGVLGTLGLVGIIVAGCAAPEAHSDGPPPEYFQEHYQKLQDGRTVLCLTREGSSSYASSSRPIAMSCDWAGAIVHPAK